MKIAVVGVTGLVGRMINEVLVELNFPYTDYIPVASTRSVGSELVFDGKHYTIKSIEEALELRPDIAIFSAGSTVSLAWAPQFAAVGTVVIDNSSAWRMDLTKKLIVPEINGSSLTKDDKIIANPNCSTIQMVMALAPIHQRYGIRRLVISTYQSFTGTGAKAVEQYRIEKNGGVATEQERAYHYPIFENAIPQCDIFLDNDYTKEEMKLVEETKKILNDDQMRITATAVRIPVDGGHSESINIELGKPFDISDIKNMLMETSGVAVLDDPRTFKYPMPLYSKGKNDVFVGRIRRDTSHDDALHMWVVADNLRKGAATNTVQIAQYLVNNQLI
ncbi:MAG: aspartate-semialdehyde dehydrogenase [Chitinophagales bacterium]|nr:aspartate-semialdehyde dehydrogenase [Chitinophagales bacterium]